MPEFHMPLALKIIKISECLCYLPDKVIGLHRISASAKPKFGHFSQIRLRPNFWPNLADANATALCLVSYLITDKI